MCILVSRAAIDAAYNTTIPQIKKKKKKRRTKNQLDAIIIKAY